MSESAAVWCVWIISSLVGIVVGLIIALNTEPTYSDGFCAARGGVAITSEYCDVEGKVVAVER